MKANRLSKAKRLSKAQRSSLDIITTLPQTIIETILCLLPIKEAARTSILSREWRYKWINIPKLVFSRPYRKQLMETSELLSAIQQIMLQRQDPIHELTLYIDEVGLFSKVGYHSRKLDKIILHLSRYHTIKKLVLEFDEPVNSLYNIPLSIFSFHHLTELYLCWCDIDHQPIFNGFGILTSLTLDCVRISIKTLVHLLSKCPSLKTFSLLVLPENILGDEKSTMIELFNCLPVIEHLTIWSEILEWFVPDLVPQELQTLPISLKYFRCEEMSFHDGYALTFLAVLIKSSPNLEKIELQINIGHFLSNEIENDPVLFEKYHSDVWLEYLSDVWLEHLNELKIHCFSNLEPELEFVKFILARSPKLKKVWISSYVKKDQESKMLKILLRAPRASAVEIDVI